jgi:glycosyltransferase involved in cell wall biosynthesis
MKIYIDVTVLLRSTNITGIQRVTRELVAEMLEIKRDAQVIPIFYRTEKRAYYFVNCSFFTKSGRAVRKKFTSEQVEPTGLRDNSIFFDIDAVWMGKVRRSYLYPILKARGAKIVTWVHDVISITHPAYCLPYSVYQFMDYMAAAYQYADTLLVSTHSTADEVSTLADKLHITSPTIHVIPFGTDFETKDKVLQTDIPKELEQIAGAAPYLLMVGTLEPRKNNGLLLDAYDRGIRDMGYHIIYAGNIGWQMDDFMMRLHTHPEYGTRIFHLEGLSDASIAYLYKHARFLIFCSYTEGFGLPLLEAISYGLPVLSVDQAIYREVAGDFSSYFAQDEPDILCEKLRYFDQHPEEYIDWTEHLKTYQPRTWKETGEAVMELLEQI